MGPYTLNPQLNFGGACGYLGPWDGEDCFVLQVQGLGCRVYRS